MRSVKRLTNDFEYVHLQQAPLTEQYDDTE